MFQVRYSRTYNLGNFESERIEIEEEFDPALTDYQVAVDRLRKEVEKAHRGRTAARNGKTPEPTPSDDALPF